MSPMTPTTRRRPALRGALLLTATLLVTTAPAQARPVVPGAVPLTILGPGAPTPVPDAALCPAAAGFDGTAGAPDLRKLLRGGRTEMQLWAIGASVAKQAVLVCDPDAARAQQFIGPLSGE